MTDMTAPRFTNEDAAREHLEALRWPNGPFCPHCGSFNAKRLPPVERKATAKHAATVRKGVVQCRDCREQYTVTVGTVFERSKVPLHKWMLANHLLCSSKKGISAHQISRMLGVQYKTAWFMMHRIREAMTDTDTGPMGGEGCTVEADETYIGKDKTAPHSRTAIRNMNKVVSLVDRSTGRAKSFVVTEQLNAETVAHILYTNVDRASTLQTDEAKHYIRPGRKFAAHYSVNHAAKEYVRRDAPAIHTNTIEGFFGIFKRGMKGIYQHCGQQHLHRYLAEFDFRYTNRIATGFNDDERAAEVLKGIFGKRLTYRRIGFAAA